MSGKKVTFDNVGTESLQQKNNAVSARMNDESGWDQVEKVLSDPILAATRSRRIRQLKEELMNNRLEIEQLQEAQRVLAGAGWGNSEPISIMSAFRLNGSQSRRRTYPSTGVAKGA